jgi:uncharacterized membrane protein YkvA (DUF1232 family)
MPEMLQSIKSWAKRVKRDAVMLWFARSHPMTPLLPRWLCYATAAYLLSPIDLIPDFIPILGYLDDAILVPVMIWLIVRLLPKVVIQESRAKAEAWMAQQHKKPVSYSGALFIVLLWGLALYLAWRWFMA